MFSLQRVGNDINAHIKRSSAAVEWKKSSKRGKHTPSAQNRSNFIKYQIHFDKQQEHPDIPAFLLTHALKHTHAFTQTGTRTHTHPVFVPPPGQTAIFSREWTQSVFTCSSVMSGLRGVHLLLLWASACLLLPDLAQGALIVSGPNGHRQVTSHGPLLHS